MVASVQVLKVYDEKEKKDVFHIAFRDDALKLNYMFLPCVSEGAAQL